MISKLKNFETFFRAISYTVVFCGFFSLLVSGGFGIIVSTLFIVVIIFAWFLEDSNWQISEKWGTASMFIIVPLFYIGWKFRLFGFTGSETAIAGMLARMILVLTSVKLLQRKSDRDWLFLYLMSFFEVLLAAGMSISPLYFASLVLYFLAIICAVIAFEIRKTSHIVNLKLSESDQKVEVKKSYFKRNSVVRLPLTAFALLVLIIAIATPLFFTLPRVGGAGMGRNSDGIAGFIGFSDSVQLGAIGQLKQNNQIVMRVVLNKSNVENSQNVLWRGVALDTFNKNTWSKSTGNLKEPFGKQGRFIRFDKPAFSADDIAIQTIYLEPIDSPVLFALSRPYAAEQASIKYIQKDPQGGISYQRSGFERISYTIYSDRKLPTVSQLRLDETLYSFEDKTRYLQLPVNYDKRIDKFAEQLTKNAENRYDKAKAVEQYLQNKFGYTLEMKASGEDPLADFLFNVREGHCEYFATAMAIMLRTQGIATRIVNGFQQGEYNETADVYVVRQKEAHSWVEVYFPGEDVWIPFDPTPAAGKFNESENVGVLASFNKYIEALETFWIQYFVAFDNDGQRSLFRSVKSGFSDFQAQTATWLKILQVQIADWWQEVRGDKGLQASAIAIGYATLYVLSGIFAILLIIWIYRKIKQLEFWIKVSEWLKQKNEATIVEFYERMQKLLASKGLVREPHQTPLEFAYDLKMPEAISITEKYNRVRFGEKNLSKDEAKEIESWLERLEAKE